MGGERKGEKKETKNGTIMGESAAVKHGVLRTYKPGIDIEMSRRKESSSNSKQKTNETKNSTLRTHTLTIPNH